MGLADCSLRTLVKIGDSAFPRLEWLIKAYKENQQSQQKLV